MNERKLKLTLREMSRELADAAENFPLDEEEGRKATERIVINLEEGIAVLEEIANISIPRPTRKFFQTGNPSE